ncbi:Metallo-dependent hydrolase [Penicillium angulare]|uniref:Metallo-dependent hydrolase n=1 Tax=Penicillium angulare TaxID=116970 RepID=UPI0025411AF2|nr:Metallo-dependent hydrolase [Penicillium angulare]KAJ5261279.1 Metallo-dependent hydrolase [Penicillium angulare]
MHYGSTVASDDGERSLTHREMIAIVEEVLSQEKKKIEQRSIAFYGFKIIYASLRGCSPWEMQWCIQDAIDLKKEFPNLICGFDLCGQEDAGKPLSFWVPDLLDMQKQCRDLDLHLPFILHAGETLDDGGDTDSNLYDAILLQSKRIGHGYSLHKHPLLIEICKQRDIAIEICPTSNELLGLCEQMQGHPVYSLLAQSVACTINTDDPGFWGSSHSHELYQITMGSNKISLSGWKRLAEWSLDHSCMDEEEKTERKRVFQEDWRLFCAWIIETFP